MKCTDKNRRNVAWMLIGFFFFLLGHQHLATGENWASIFIQQETTTQSEDILQSWNAYLKHPYVYLVPSFGTSMLSPDPADAVQLQDLRGVECFAQPDQLNLCGSGDTIPILLFTKSVAPIYDINLTVNFDDGLEYGMFAYVHSGPAELDTVNTDNEEAPVFRISELSQGGGAVVVYIGVRAACEINLDLNNPNITFATNYVAAGENCTGTFMPDTPYGSNVSIPEVVFAGPPDPAVVEVEAYTTDFCTTISLTQVTLDAGALGALLTVEDYGFDIGNTVSALRVDGTPVPASDIMVDATTGNLVANLDGMSNTTYFGGDGILAFAEESELEICFQSTSCYDEVEPVLSVVFACNGELCTGNPDFSDELVVRNEFNFNVDWTSSNVTVIQEAAVCGVDGDPDNFIVTWTFSNPVQDSTADALNLFFAVDACPSFSADTVYLSTGAIPQGRYVRTGSGQFQLNLNNWSELLTDPDGPGGLDDVDGDGFYDDLPGEESLQITMEMSPALPAGETMSCQSEEGASCSFDLVRTNYNRDCGQQRVGATAPIPGDNAYNNTSTAGIGGDTTTTNIGGVIYSGVFDFGVIGYTAANPNPNNGSTGGQIDSTKTVNFNFSLSDNDLNQCDNLGNRYVLVQFSSSVEQIVEDLELSNLSFSGGGTQTVTRNQVDASTVEFVIDDAAADAVTPDTEFIYSFDLTLDTNICISYFLSSLSIYVIDECQGCGDEATVVRSCESIGVWVNPDDNPNCQCNFFSYGELRRCSFGFTDPTLATQVTQEDIANIGSDDPPTVLGGINPNKDTLKVLPGDLVELKTKIHISSADPFNDRTRNVSFLFILEDENRGPYIGDLTFAFDLPQAQLTEITHRRNTTETDLGNISPEGPLTPSILDGGILVGSGSASDYDFSGPPQPAILHDNYIFTAGRVTNDGNGDGGRVSVGFYNPIPGTEGQYALDSLYAAIGGQFLPNDTICMTWKIPVISLPDTIAQGGAILRTSDIGSVRADVDSRDYINAAGNASIDLAGGAITCSEHPRLQLFEPRPAVDTDIVYSEDGCDASITLDFYVENLPPVECFPNDYRPILGLETFDLELPASYYYELGAATAAIIREGTSYQTTLFQPDSTPGLDSVVCPDRTFLLANPDRGNFIFVDSEKADGIEWARYEADYRPDFDLTLVGGDLPLLGVGLNAADTLRLTLPIERLCPQEPDMDLRFTYQASYPYLADYDIPAFYCSDGNRYLSGECPPGIIGNSYYPIGREDADNPHRFSGDQLLNETGTPTALTISEVNLDMGVLSDGAGSEMNSYFFVAGTDIPGGVLAIEVANAVELQSVSGDANSFVEAVTTDSTVIYSVDIPMLSANDTFAIDLTTDLEYCGTAFVCIQPSIGCFDEPEETAAILIKAGADCGDNEKLCYRYIAGLADVVSTFDYPSNQNGCLTETYNLQFRNIGTSDLTQFSPTVYLPEGLLFTPGSFSVQTFSPNDGPTMLVNPTENTAQTGVYGVAFEWAPGYFASIAGTDTIEGGEIVVLSFMATPSCDFTSGQPLATRLNASAACDREFGGEPTIGPPVNIVPVPDPSAPAFTFELADNRISCAENTEPITLTATNTGKAPSDSIGICFVLPAGITLGPEDISAIAPEGYIPQDITSGPVGNSGATEICFSGPMNIEVGGFFCLNLDPQVGDVECGIYDVGFRITRTTTIDCAGTTCDIEVLGSDAYFTLEVVPRVDVSAASLVANCSAVAGNTDLQLSVDFENLGLSYSDQVTVDLFFDIDGSGEIEANDPLLISVNENLTIAAGAEQTIIRSFTVPEDQACPVLVRVTVPGCFCDEVVFPFDPVQPAFIAEAGNNYVICPGDIAVFAPVCGTYDLSLEPESAGAAFQSNDSIIVVLNEGFGVDAPVTLTASNMVGNCGSQAYEIFLTQSSDFSFGPYEFEVCKVGCQILDLDIPTELQEDLEIQISPALYLDDPTSHEPEICDPEANVNYTIDFSLNGSCMASTTMSVFVRDEATVNLINNTACSSGVVISDIVTVSPMGIDALVTSSGDGTFEPTSVPPSSNPDYQFPQAYLSDAAIYIPGPGDRQNGEVMFTVRTENPDGPCGGAVARQTFTILLVDCGTFPWVGND